MNGRRWTNDDFQFEERIECTMNHDFRNRALPLSAATSRSELSSCVQQRLQLGHAPRERGDFEISWDGSSNIQFSIDQYRDNLSSILAYYAYMILGMDYDSMALDGSTYLKAQTIVANAQTPDLRDERSQGNQNRYWLVENMLSQTFRPVRNCLYYYHRMGLDQLFDDVEAGRLAMADALIEMHKPTAFDLPRTTFSCSSAIR